MANTSVPDVLQDLLDLINRGRYTTARDISNVQAKIKELKLAAVTEAGLPKKKPRARRPRND